MIRSHVLAAALVVGTGLGMLGPASQSVALPALAEPGCTVTDATLTWGFKESFRAYIDGDIANGEWTTSGGASYDTPAFSWLNGNGRFDPESGTGHVQFEGSVRFTGHDGLLDTTISDPVLNIDRDQAFLILDVAGPSMEGEQVDAQDVEFVELSGIEVSGDVPRVTLATESVLTADGEAAFPDYQAGTAFDPLGVALQLESCSPPGGWQGDDISPTPGPPLMLIAGAIAGPLLLIAAVVTAVVVVTRRRARA